MFLLLLHKECGFKSNINVNQYGIGERLVKKIGYFDLSIICGFRSEYSVKFLKFLLRWNTFHVTISSFELKLISRIKKKKNK